MVEIKKGYNECVNEGFFLTDSEKEQCKSWGIPYSEYDSVVKGFEEYENEFPMTDDQVEEMFLSLENEVM